MTKALSHLLTRLIITFSCLLSLIPSAAATEQHKPTVILVHGAWSDGSSWSKVIPKLQERGIKVVAVQNPLTSLSDDVATTKRAIDAIEGPIVLVGHSYGGAVVTEAGNSDKVKALVYIAAFAPEKGQSVLDLGTHLPPSPGVVGLTPDKLGFYHLTLESIKKNLAPDLSSTQARVLAATQGPTSIKVFNEKVSACAWKDKANFYLVATEDRMIQPDLEREFAKSMKATTVEVPSSHVALLSHPDEVAKFIMTAVNSLKYA